MSLVKQEVATNTVWVLVVGVLLVVANPISAALAQGEWKPGNVWFWVQVTTVALLFLLGKYETRQAKKLQQAAEARELSARVETRVALADLLEPMSNLLGEMGTANDEDKKRLGSEAVQVALAAAANFVGPERSRACWFEIQSGPPRQLESERATGRTGSARSVFTAGTESGDAALALVDQDESLICDDLLSDPPPGWDNRERDYRSFMSVAVFTNGTPYGMLTLDAPHPNAFTDEDMLTLRLLAKLLAAALAQ